MQENTLSLFTSRGLEGIVKDGCSHSWVLNYLRARQCLYALFIQNRRSADLDDEYADGTAPHGTAFMVGKISGVHQSKDREGRWIVLLSEYARISIPNAVHGRNPVGYTDLALYGIDPDKLEFQPVSGGGTLPSPPRSSAPVSAVPTLTIAEAKKQLAAAYGIKPEAIEITIRG